MEKINKILEFVDNNKLYPDLRYIESAAEPEVDIEGKKILMFSSNNYLGLATHPKLINATIEATKKFGVGSGGSRLLSGNITIHREAEIKILEFKGGEDCIIFPCGYSANLGTIAAVAGLFKVSASSYLDRKTVILSDELNHASIIDGCKLSGQTTVVFKHNDLKDLEKKLKKYRSRRKIIIVDGVFSMDGDIAPLPEIVALAKNIKL